MIRSMMSRGHAALAMSLLAIGASPAAGAIVSGVITGGTVLGSGNFVVLDPASAPFSVGDGGFNSNNLFAFAERRGYRLLADYTVDVGAGGVRVIAAGTVIDSYLVFFDPLERERVSGTVQFDAQVLGIDRKGASLIAGSSVFGNSNVTYNTSPYFGLEPGLDFVAVGAPNAYSIKIERLADRNPGDQFRVFTLTAVPEPSSWAMMIIGFAAAGMIQRRRGKRVGSMLCQNAATAESTGAIAA